MGPEWAEKPLIVQVALAEACQVGSPQLAVAAVVLVGLAVVVATPDQVQEGSGAGGSGSVGVGQGRGSKHGRDDDDPDDDPNKRRKTSDPPKPPRVPMARKESQKSKPTYGGQYIRPGVRQGVIYPPIDRNLSPCRKRKKGPSWDNEYWTGPRLN